MSEEFKVCPCCGKPLAPDEREEAKRRYEMMISMYKEGRRDAERPEVREEKWRIWIRPSWMED
jgi:hypothetical protein